MFRTMKITFRILAITFIGLTVVTACSEKVNNGLVAATNLKKIGVDEKNLDRVDSLIATGLVNNWMAGATALIAVDGKVIYDKGFGFRDRETKALMRPIDQFRIASMTKPIVTAAAMILVEQGKLKLTDPVSKYIPEFKDMKVLAPRQLRSSSVAMSVNL